STDSSDRSEDDRLAAAMRDHGKIVVASRVAGFGKGEVGGHESELPVDPIRSASRFGCGEFPRINGGARRQFSLRSVTNMAWIVAELVSKAPDNRLARRWLNFYGPPKSIGPWFSYADI